jgi:chaperonin GroES
VLWGVSGWLADVENLLPEKSYPVTFGNSGWEAGNMMLKLRPLADRVIVEPIERDETFAGGELVLPETAKEKPQQGVILAAGPGRLDDAGDRIALEVQVGDRVLYAKYSGTEIKLDDKKVLIFRESDILAVVES